MSWWIKGGDFFFEQKLCVFWLVVSVNFCRPFCVMSSAIQENGGSKWKIASQLKYLNSTLIVTMGVASIYYFQREQHTSRIVYSKCKATAHIWCDLMKRHIHRFRLVKRAANHSCSDPNWIECSAPMRTPIRMAVEFHCAAVQIDWIK